MCQWPKGAWSTRRVPTGAQPVVLTRLVFKDVSSINTSLSSMLTMNGWRSLTQSRRIFATSGRNCSLASSVFFMAEAKPVQPFADRAAMHGHPMSGQQFAAQFIQREVGLDRQPIPHPARVGGQLAMTAMALPLRRKTAAFALQYDHVVHKFRRNPEVSRVRHLARTGGASMAHHGARALPPQTR